MKNNRYLYLIVLGYFMLGLVNIHFALLGLICMSIPFILLFKNTQKTWCQGYCPRASLLNKVGKSRLGRSKASPKFFSRGNMKWIMLIYFGISLTFISLSTLRVATAGVAPMEMLRLLIVIPLPFEMPQLIELSGIAPWLTHLSYRFYSMMLTTTLIGLVLSVLYKPRTWCTVCPISTISGQYISQKTKKEQAFE